MLEVIYKVMVVESKRREHMMLAAKFNSTNTKDKRELTIYKLQLSL